MLIVASSVWFPELDPWGAEVYRSDPYISDPQFSGGRGESGPVFPGFGDLSMGSRGCMLDGVYTLCDFLDRNREALARLLIEGGKTKVFNLNGGALGVFAVWIEDAGEKLQKPQTPFDAEFSADDVIVTNTDSDGLGHWELINLGSELMSLGPQNSYSEVYRKVEEVLKESKCAQFAKHILSAVSSKNNPVYPDDGTLLDVFREFIKQPTSQPLFTTNLPADNLGYGNPMGNIKRGTALMAFPGFPYADGIIGELFHLAGRNRHYSDKQLAEAVRKFPAYAKVADQALDPTLNIYDSRYKAPPNWTEANQGGYSAYFHYAQYNICFTAPPNNGMKRLIR